MAQRDYNLKGRDARLAVKSGLSGASWYQTDIPRKDIKALMKRTDQPAIRDTILLFAVMAVSLIGGIVLWDSWFCVPFWLVYGVLYGSAMDSRWHECGHGTAFRTAWMNTALYHVACFCMVRNPPTWRWSHARHHTDTIIVGRDPEISATRPPNLFKLALNFLGVFDVLSGWWRMLINASGKLDPQEVTYIPESEVNKVIVVARTWLAIYVAVIILAFITNSFIPLMVIGLPRLYGAWHHVLTGLLQHGGLADNAIDHRLNSRTVYINPVSRFIYWNMNYHVEHHMFPMVPYHRLPELHTRLNHDLPAANTSMWQAWRDEVLPAFFRQLGDPDYYLKRPLPDGAAPYRYWTNSAENSGSKFGVVA